MCLHYFYSLSVSTECILSIPFFRQTEEPTVVFADNHAYGNARIQGNTDNASGNNKNNQVCMYIPITDNCFIFRLLPKQYKIRSFAITYIL